MFDVAWTEILVVAVIAIIVVGPKELPAMLRAFGKTFGQVRRTAREFQSTFNDALREAERQANLDEVRKDIDSVRSMDPTKSLRKGLDETKRQLSGKIDDAAPPKPDVVPLKTESGAAASGEATAPPPAVPPAAEAETPAAGDSVSEGAGEGETRRAAAAGSER
ncbi:Sec-independent protein translocase protein TatB [Acuticoccus sp. I52.16.1]|uniref:Sec-independent protein translocase protein TatB n=1 Tax=Acuticoccus sp. I52.16.1 TaxID=2928472 RepID=UPI001FD0641A|nr:Sec-independent protein translocase protein TatB [Acuticoccus sp. I52.16.1]UOM34539.1 Sec-independent protein translocase protein TatB [Acuticoccus sp. I52.16.1]